MLNDRLNGLLSIFSKNCGYNPLFRLEIWTGLHINFLKIKKPDPIRDQVLYYIATIAVVKTKNNTDNTIVIL
jgi:hypothetical protein